MADDTGTALLPRLVCTPGGRAARLLASVPALGRAYTPTPWAKGPNAQTIIGRAWWGWWGVARRLTR